MYSVSLSGFVETRDIRERTDRFVLRVAKMESPRAQTELERVRLSVRKGRRSELQERETPPYRSLQFFSALADLFALDCQSDQEGICLKNR
jgi:hypothetical protein